MEGARTALAQQHLSLALAADDAGPLAGRLVDALETVPGRGRGELGMADEVDGQPRIWHKVLRQKSEFRCYAQSRATNK